eukprot:COSAG02_NODE_235_length_27784_cov_9.895828_15_plen_67_part_00
MHFGSVAVVQSRLTSGIPTSFRSGKKSSLHDSACTLGNGCISPILIMYWLLVAIYLFAAFSKGSVV